MPATEYQLQVEGHNAAGSTLADYYFFTLTEDGGESLARSVANCLSSLYLLTIRPFSFVRFAEEPPPELVEKSQISRPFYYMDMKMAIPVLGTFVAVLAIVCTAIVCLKRSTLIKIFDCIIFVMSVDARYLYIDCIIINRYQ